MTTIELPARISNKIEPEPNSGCWLWIGARTGNGYAHAYYQGRMVRAHRVVYLMNGGEIPDGYDLDHLCRTRCCVNPRHLEPVTRQENLLRGETITAAHRATTHCPSGHPYTEDNTYYRPSGSRRCRACALARSGRHYQAVLKALHPGSWGGHRRKSLGPVFGADLDDA